MQQILKKGSYGVVRRTNEDGNALIDFFYEGKSGGKFVQWVLKRDFCKMDVEELANTVKDGDSLPPWHTAGGNGADSHHAGRGAAISPRSPFKSTPSGVYYDGRKGRRRQTEDESDDFFSLFACCATRERDGMQPVRSVVR